MVEVVVKYSRRIALDGADRCDVGGGITFPIPDDADWQQAWEGAYAVLKTTVDQAASLLSPSATPTEAEAPPQPSSSATPEVSQNGESVDKDGPPDIDPEAKVELRGARVQFNAELKTDSKKREYARARIGHDQVPGTYVHIMSYEPGVMEVIKNLRKGDDINVTGSYEQPWKGRDGGWNFRLEAATVERV